MSSASEDRVNADGVSQRWRSRSTLRILTVASLIVTALWWWWSAGRAATDNARLEGPVHPISARISGNIEESFVALHQRVAAGEAMFQLDPRDFEVAVAEARAALAAAEAAAVVAQREVPVGSTSARSEQTGARADERNARTGIDVAERSLERAEAQQRARRAALEQAKARAATAARDLERIEPLAAKQQISAQQLDAARSRANSTAADVDRSEAELAAAAEDVAIAGGLLDRAKGELARARAERAAADTAPQRVQAIEARAALADAELEAARAALRRAELDLADTTVRAPTAGVIGRKAIEPGQYVRRGEPLLALVADEVWVEANFKETQLRKMSVGQRAKISVDAYSGSFTGRVESIGPATGSRFSLLPADNSSGNFVKVVQRVPVKIVFDEMAEERRPGPLRPGMSVHVVVDLRSDPQPSGTDAASAP